jgi:hypothetical protein
MRRPPRRLKRRASRRASFPRTDKLSPSKPKGTLANSFSIEIAQKDAKGFVSREKP